MSRPFSLFPDPDSRRPATIALALTELAPVFVLYILAALLAVVPNTRLARAAILPPSFFVAWRAGTGVYFTDPLNNHLNYGLLIVLLVMQMRVIDWAQRSKHFQRVEASSASRTTSQLLRDALDLATNLRGIGWDYGANCPKELSTPITSFHPLDSLLRSIFYAASFDICITSARTLSVPITGQSATLFDDSLPPLPRYAKAVLITLFTGTSIFSGMNSIYQLTSVVGVVVFRQAATEWPALFDTPFISTNLGDFWGKRWHQMFRRIFLVVGGKPMNAAFGKLGGIVGVFLVSGLLHDWGMWGMGQGVEYQSVTGYFLLQSVGLAIEGAFELHQGHPPGGPFARLWALLWVVCNGIWMVDAWMRRGLGNCSFLPPELRITHWIWAAFEYNTRS